jgi:hypothetical protein
MGIRDGDMYCITDSYKYRFWLERAFLLRLKRLACGGDWPIQNTLSTRVGRTLPFRFQPANIYYTQAGKLLTF